MLAVRYQGFPDSSVGKEFSCNAGYPSWIPGWGRSSWKRDKLPTPVFLGFPCGSAGKESACNLRDLGLIPRLERSPGGGKGYLPQYSSLENSIDCIVHGVTKSQTRLRTFTFFFTACWGLPSWVLGKESACNSGDTEDQVPSLGLFFCPLLLNMQFSNSQGF